MGRYLKFDYLFEDKVCSTITVDRETREVKVENFTDNVLMQFLGKNEPTIENVLKFMRYRCFPEERQDVKILLRMLGLSTYSPLDICLKTHGRLTCDHFWIRFDGEKLTWNDLKC